MCLLFILLDMCGSKGNKQSFLLVFFSFGMVGSYQHRRDSRGRTAIRWVGCEKGMGFLGAGEVFCSFFVC